MDTPYTENPRLEQKFDRNNSGARNSANFPPQFGTSFSISSSLFNSVQLRFLTNAGHEIYYTRLLRMEFALLKERRTTEE